MRLAAACSAILLTSCSKHGVTSEIAVTLPSARDLAEIVNIGDCSCMNIPNGCMTDVPPRPWQVRNAVCEWSANPSASEPICRYEGREMDYDGIAPAGAWSPYAVVIGRREGRACVEAYAETRDQPIDYHKKSRPMTFDEMRKIYGHRP